MLIKTYTQCDYTDMLDMMKTFTLQRQATTPDEVWMLEHNAVYTLGQASKREHILYYNTIPIIQSDRGGQVTYHGPGQLIIYFLLNIQRRNLGVRTLVCKIENLIVDYLQQLNLAATTQCGAPGVYINQEKIASIGLRVKNGCTYHGLAFNINMDLSPFKAINPCGFRQLTMTKLQNFYPQSTVTSVMADLLPLITMQFDGVV